MVYSSGVVEEVTVRLQALLKNGQACPSLFVQCKQSTGMGAAMDRFDAMQAFARVVEAGSFTKAAQTLHMSKTTVTQLVQQLEARLRVRLLNRTTRKVNVTADGAIYYERVLRLLADMEDAEGSLSGASTAPSGHLRIDVPSPLARLVLIPALPAFHARYPDIQIDMGVSDRMVDLIGEKVDCVIRGGDITDLSLKARRIGELQTGVYAAPGYLAQAGMPRHPRELEEDHHRIVGFMGASTNKLLTCPMSRGDEYIDIRGRTILAVDDGNAYLAAGLAGLGALWLLDYMVGEHLARGELVRLFDDWQIAPMPLTLAYAPNRHVSARLRVFIDWVVELMAGHAPVSPAPHGSVRA
jgi:DNA-binding transcriptional LysR family regulator